MFPPKLTEVFAGVGVQAGLIPPLMAALAFAWMDIRTRRIPNFLTIGTAVAGLGFQWGYGGWEGLLNGILGFGLGFGLLILPYALGGVGGGDVKALAALGAWMNPVQTMHLFLYMALAGGGLALGMLCWKGLLSASLRSSREWFSSRILCFSHGVRPPNQPSPGLRLPYGPALALGMGLVIFQGVW